MELPTDASQWTAVAQEGTKLAAVLSWQGQVAVAIGVTVIVGLLIWTRRPQRSAEPGAETTRLVVGAMSEQAQAVGALAAQVGQVVEQNQHVVQRVDMLVDLVRALMERVPQREREAA